MNKIFSPSKKPIPVKETFCFSFGSGYLVIKTRGYEKNELFSGFFTFNEGKLGYEQNDESGLVYRIANMHKSELIALRDILNKILPITFSSGEVSSLLKPRVDLSEYKIP